MSKFKIGFIGCGNMAAAIISGIISSELFERSSITAADLSKEQLEKIGSTLGISTSTTNSSVVADSEIIVLAVKPQVLDTVLDEISSAVTNDKLIISIVAGKSIDFIAERLPAKTAIIRTMPNTPALVGKGMTSITPNDFVTTKQRQTTLEIFSSFGKAEIIPENLIDAVVGVSGSSPAYVFMLIEAMADAAVEAGLPRDTAYRFVAQAVLGSAKMVLDIGEHPAALKDKVCSPGGTTIEAVRVLDEKNFRGAIKDAIKTCIEKSKSL